MRARYVALQLWAAVTLTWLACCGAFAASDYLSTQLSDAVRLQQQARDVRAVGYDPVGLTGAEVTVGGVVVPPVQIAASGYWAREGAGWARLGLSLPLPLLVLLEGLVRGVALCRPRVSRARVSRAPRAAAVAG